MIFTFVKFFYSCKLPKHLGEVAAAMAARGGGGGGGWRRRFSSSVKNIQHDGGGAESPV